jgi:hypothetical protein
MAVATVSFATSGALAATDPVTIVAKAGYSGFVKAQQWMPVTVDVTNTGPDLDGTLEVSAAVTSNGPPIGAAHYQTHLSLVSGATKHLKAWVIEDQAPSPVSVRILQNGRVVASADAASGSAATALVGVLSDQPTALDGLAAVHPGGASATVVHLSLENLSDSAIQLRAFDLLVIDDFATDTLTTAQRGAITDFVQNGGTLLLGTGASWRKTLAGVAPAILPMSIDGTTTLDSVAALDNALRLEVATGPLNPGARAWLSEGVRPLLTTRSVGGGSVTLATFDWAQEPVASLSPTNPLLRQTLTRTLLSASPGQGVASFKGGFGGGGSSITERSSNLTQALGSLPALDLPSLVVIGLLVLAYVLLVGPINYFALRALHHRALAWVTVPLIAVVASAGAFGAGVFNKGRSVQTNQVSIVHLEPGWDRAYQESYTGVLTPTRGDFQVKLTGSRPMVGPLFSNNGGGPLGPNADLIQVSSDSNTIVLPGMTAFVLRGFATEGLIDAPHLVGDAKLVNGKLTGTIRNDSQVRFTDAVVLAGDGYQLLPALGPGATAAFEVTPKPSNPYGGQPAIYTIYGNYYNGPQPGQPTDAERDGIEKTSILSVVAGGSFFSPAITPMVVAWTKQPNEPITVSGSQPRATTMTAVVLPLSFGSVGAGALPAGLVVSHFTDIEGDTQAGPPDALLMQSGTVTYEFTPGIAAGMHLKNASLDSTAQSPKMAPGSASSQSMQAAYWDWSKAAWVQLSYTALGTSALPDAAIEPSSNEVRLRMTISGGPVLVGAISLTGTVN